MNKKDKKLEIEAAQLDLEDLILSLARSKRIKKEMEEDIDKFALKIVRQYECLASLKMDGR